MPNEPAVNDFDSRYEAVRDAVHDLLPEDVPEDRADWHKRLSWIDDDRGWSVTLYVERS